MSSASDGQFVDMALRRETLVFPALPSCVADCRHKVLARLREWRTPVDLDTVELLVSETVTNAIVHGTSRHGVAATVRVELRETGIGLRFRVHDPDEGGCAGRETRPHEGEPCALAESGRGLSLVEALSEDWGFKEEPGGKFVHFLLPYTDAAAEEQTTRHDQAHLQAGFLAVEARVMEGRCGNHPALARYMTSLSGRSPWRIKYRPHTVRVRTATAPADVAFRAPSSSPASRFDKRTRTNWRNSRLPRTTRSSSPPSRDSDPMQGPWCGNVACSGSSAGCGEPRAVSRRSESAAGELGFPRSGSHRMTSDHVPGAPSESDPDTYRDALARTADSARIGRLR